MKRILLTCLFFLICICGTSSALAKSDSLGDSTDSNIGRKWSNDFDFPTEDECRIRSTDAGNADFSKEERSPYLCAWLTIDGETRYNEYCVDIKADYLPAGTYCSGANWFLDLSGLKKQYETVKQEGISGYAGFYRGQENNGYGVILSLWDIECTDYAGEKTTISAKQTYPAGKDTHRFDHEGNGVNSIVPYEWRAEHWYRMLLKCGTSKETGNTTVEQWIMDLTTSEWAHICTFDTGIRDTCFIGSCAFFLENYLQEYAGEVRSMEIANIRIHTISDDEWHDVTSVNGIAKQSGTGSWQAGADKNSFYMITTGVPGHEGSTTNKTLSITNSEIGAPYQKLPEQYAISFQDILSDAYYAVPVGWAVQNGITNGTSPTTFSPNRTCTRGEIITFLWRAAGSPEPKEAAAIIDVNSSDYYYKAVLWAAENKIFSDSSFAPNSPCTRAMAMEFIWNQAGSHSTSTSSAFTDVPSSASYAQAVTWALNEGITDGTSNTTFSPDATCTRGQIVTFLFRTFAE